MQHSTDPLFKVLFDQLPDPRIILQPNAPDFTVVAINKAYANATGYTPEQVIGHSIWEFFKADAAGSSSAEKFRAGLEDALLHRTEMKLPIFRFDAVSPGRVKPRWWQVQIAPVNDENGQPLYLACTTHNVTIHVEDQAAILQGHQYEAAMLVQQQHTAKELASSESALRTYEDDLEAARQDNEDQRKRNTELTDSEYRLNRIFANTPAGLCIITGTNLTIEAINTPLLNIWGRKKDDVVGKPLLSIMPEMEGQPFPKLLQEVLSTGKSMTMLQEPVVMIRPDGSPKNGFADFSYEPLFNTDQQPEAVLVTVNDVTEMVEARQLLQARQEELEAMNEEMSAANEELQAMNEEITTTNEELHALNEELTSTTEQLQEAYTRLEERRGSEENS